MRVVVTGAQGFIGRALVHRLAQADVTVLAVGRRSEPSSKQITVIEADCGHWGWTQKLPGADVVVHLAQSRRHREFPDGGPDMVRINIDATAELLDWSSRFGVRRLLYASTGNVYAASALPLTEHSPCDPASFYAVTKWAAERIVTGYAGQVPSVILRLFGVYGPGQHQGLFVALMDAVQTGRPISVAGERGLRLTPLYIEDCVEVLARLVHEKNQPGCSILNLAGDEPVDLVAIAEAMGRATGRAPVFQRTKEPPASLIADSSALYARLGWRPPTSLSDGIARMIAVDA